MTVQVLFICLGNICRSPMADGVFQEMVNKAGLSAQIQVDSAGTGDWHIGDRAHSGTRAILAKHNIAYNGRSRQVTDADMADPNTYIIGMDSSNVRDLNGRFSPHPRLYKLLDFATETAVSDVPDPYYHNNFDTVYELVQDGCRGLLAMICEQEKLSA